MSKIVATVATAAVIGPVAWFLSQAKDPAPAQVQAPTHQEQSAKTVNLGCITQPNAPAVACCVLEKAGCSAGPGCVDKYRDRVQVPEQTQSTTQEIICLSLATTKDDIRDCKVACP